MSWAPFAHLGDTPLCQMMSMSWKITTNVTLQCPEMRVPILNQIDLIELIWMMLGIVHFNFCMTSNYQSKIINCLIIMDFFLYIVNNHQCNLFAMCSFFNSLLQQTTFIPNYQSLFFKLTQLAWLRWIYLGNPPL